MALLAMPFSYGVKLLLGFPDLIWIDPTLILGVLAFLLASGHGKKTGIWIVGYAFASALIGTMFLAPSFDRGRLATYVVYVEPIRLALNMIWFWTAAEFLRRDSAFCIRWVSASVLLEFCIAAYLYLGLYNLVPLPAPAQLYLDIFKGRQVVWLGDTPIYRMAGTFDESPLFGLFVFCSFVVLVLYLRWASSDRRTTAWARLGAVVAFIGCIASLSDQVLFALLAFGLVFVLSSLNRRIQNHVRVALLSVLLVFIAFYGIDRLMTKFRIDSVSSGDTYGQSIGERWFHTRYGLGLFLEDPAAAVSGIGPGRYGDYAVRTGFYPSTVTPQVTPIAWLVEYGLVGCILIYGWLFRIGMRAARTHGWLALGALVALFVADLLQANWCWEFWFLALAFLHWSAPEELPGFSTVPVGPQPGRSLAQARL